MYFLDSSPIADKFLVDKIGYIVDILDLYRLDRAALDPKIVRFIRIILEIIRLITIITINVMVWYIIIYITDLNPPKTFVGGIELSDYKKYFIFFIICLIIKYFNIYIFEKDLMRENKPQGY